MINIYLGLNNILNLLIIIINKANLYLRKDKEIFHRGMRLWAGAYDIGNVYGKLKLKLYEA